jgi:hypothetical protein
VTSNERTSVIVSWSVPATISITFVSWPLILCDIDHPPKEKAQATRPSTDHHAPYPACRVKL